MTRKFESDYRLRESDDVLVKLRAVFQDLDLRIDAVEIIAKAFKEGNRLDVDALVKSINSDFAQKSAAFQEVLDEIAAGLTPDRVLETPEKRFTSDEEISSLQAADSNLSFALSSKLNSSTFVAHRDNIENPHQVTKEQLGLSNVDNIAPADMPVSTEQAAALAEKADIADLADKLGGGPRNTVQHGDNANGVPTFLTTGSGLTPAFTATNPLVISFADGFNANGAKDLLTRLTAGASLVAIAASCISYLAATYVDGSNVTWSATKAPPQYGATYNKAAQSCLKLNNNALDDFGNAWTNTNVTFSNASPMIAGAHYGVFNGATSYLRSTDFSTLYPANSGGGWSMGGRFNVIGLVNPQCFFSATNSYGYGVSLRLSTAGKVLLNLSSTGTSWDIANGSAGAATIAANVDHVYEVVQDPVAGKYYVYVDGVLDQTVTSTLKICAVSQITVGSHFDVAQVLPFGGKGQAFEFLPYCRRPAGTTYSVPTTLPDITAAGYASDWFDTVAQQMKSISAASGASGSNPTFTTSKKVYVGEAQAGASSVSSVTAYAFNQTGKNGAGLLNTFGYARPVDVTSQRSIATKYFNTLPVPIDVSITLANAGSSGAFGAVLNVNDVQRDGAFAIQQTGAGNYFLTLKAVVPPGGSYNLAAGVSISLSKWTEDR